MRRLPVAQNLNLGIIILLLLNELFQPQEMCREQENEATFPPPTSSVHITLLRNELLSVYLSHCVHPSLKGQHHLEFVIFHPDWDNHLPSCFTTPTIL